MALVSYALITLDELKTYLGVSGTENDALYELLINNVTDWIETYTERRFAETAYTDEKYDGCDYCKLVLKQYPVNSGETFTIDERLTVGGSFSEITSTDYTVDYPRGIVCWTSNFKEGCQNYAVTYTAGYSTIPNDLKQAAMMLIAGLLDLSKGASKTGNVKSETLGDHSVTFGTITENNQAVFLILNKYKITII